jgi:hypothetical protein
MTNSVGSDRVSPRDEMGDVLSRVQQLDPTSEDAAIRRYMGEMAEADALLDSVELSNAPLLVPFSAAWPERAGR